MRELPGLTLSLGNFYNRRKTTALSPVPDDWLTHLAHECRMPLHNILAATELLMEAELLGDLNARQLEYVDVIRHNGHHLLGTLEDILDAFKDQRTTVRPNREPLAIRPLLQETRALISPLLARKSQYCEINVASDVPEQFSADRGKMIRMLSNLLSNAHKFSPHHSTIRLRCEFRQESLPKAARRTSDSKDARRSFLLFSVTDEGAGMPPEQLAWLQQTNQQEGASRLSLGLPLVKKLAELHGGWLEVLSDPGEGSDCRIWIPYQAFTDSASNKSPNSMSLADGFDSEAF